MKLLSGQLNFPHKSIVNDEVYSKRFKLVCFKKFKEG